MGNLFVPERTDGLLLQNASALVSHSSPQNEALVTASVPESKPKKRMCCACPETKKLRDECIVEHGEETWAKWIEAHL
ncbi:hypothetical protein SLEP1_g41391 [Rubroshorea leprosula]|uniref:Uncharacterized protein n=1 Tax=Rubroshorea leprosula TaxID=152421 RepID=A0AAV5L6D2_9ROSI|nr:hypothetical protein SLEP1_g41391 [Rubroshorea leprosula]